MKLEKFAEEIQNTGYDLDIQLKNNKIVVKAFEPEFNSDIYEITADLEYIDNLEGKRIDELTLIITEVV